MKNKKAKPTQGDVIFIGIKVPVTLHAALQRQANAGDRSLAREHYRILADGVCAMECATCKRRICTGARSIGEVGP